MNPEVIQFNKGTQPQSPLFYIIGKGFIYPKHKEAIESIGGKIVDKIEQADWVVILTPNYLHYQTILYGLKKGKNVLCEKPLVLNSKHCEKLIKNQGTQKIFTIAQLRFHPILAEIPQKPYNEIEIFVNVHRDEDYFKSWQGDPKKSGGILFNLGIHYLDLVIYLYGEPQKSGWTIMGPKENSGWFKGEKYNCHYTFSLKAEKDKQQRIFRINNIEYNLQEPENLHKYIYQDLLVGKGIKPIDVLPVIKLIEKLQ